MIIRVADKADDWPEIFKILRAFADQSGLRPLLPENEDDFELEIAFWIDLPIMYVLLAEQDGEILGGLGYTIAPMLWNRQRTECLEQFWWVWPGAPARTAINLYKSMMGAKHGATVYGMYSLPTSPDGIGKLYERLGFKVSQTGYRRVV